MHELGMSRVALELGFFSVFEAQWPLHQASPEWENGEMTSHHEKNWQDYDYVIDSLSIIHTLIKWEMA